MTAIEHPALSEFLERFHDHPDARANAQHWRKFAAKDQGDGIGGARLELYESATRITEEALWSLDCPDDLLELYQRLFREMEAYIASSGNDNRYDVVVVIPVADRPQQLQNCLGSLLTLCQCFGYGGVTKHGYEKISVLIADDSKEPTNISQHRQLVEHFMQQGLKILYFGQTEQLQQLDLLSQQQRHAVARVIGSNRRTAFYHKGASITRNLAYLKLAELEEADRHRLFWFMDSDQEFRINTGVPDRTVYAINYFHHLNQIFSSTDSLVLTGKVVGDPPVSPAVMAGNFLEDVIAFLAEMASLASHQTCRFHAHPSQSGDAAAYHDMADLFGFKLPATAARYACGIAEVHDHARCFADFSAKLNRFFDGEHPTRQTHYAHQELLSGVMPARTVYTGNYVMTATSLEFFIPFATLKLRMAGPVLGRILQARLGRQFVSANLPLLHKRTLDELGRSEFRPGIARENQQVDLSDEFERQFYGDVMLFTVENLCQQGYPFEAVAEACVGRLLTSIEASMRKKYSAKQAQIQTRLNALKALFYNPQQWWNRGPEQQHANENLRNFIRDMEHNFGEASPGYRMINSASHRQQRKQDLLEAIMQLPQDRASWLQVLAKSQSV
jgi:hypothetical protein